MSAIVEFAGQLKSRIDITDVVQGYVELRPAGANLKGLCPLHREKTPSFTVSPAKQIFHCFGCGEGGDVIKFIEKVEHTSWMDALRFLAEKYRVPLPEFRPGTRQDGEKERDARDEMLRLHAMAAQFFAKQLASGDKKLRAKAEDYLATRQLDAELVSRFGLGLAPEGWNNFMNAARAAGFSPEAQRAGGLIVHRAEKDSAYDRFRARLIFPVCDAMGRPIAFGARVFLPDAAPDEPKYINSPETEIYKKGRHLYALHLAKESIVREKCALMMEGYMDVIRAHQHGFHHAVASCGTALTADHVNALKKLCREVVFVYDGDEAGQKAMLGGCEILLEHEMTVRVVVLPEKHDPDSFLRKNGREGFQKQINEAQPIMTFLLRHAGGRFNRRTPEGKVQIVDFVLPFLEKVRNGILRAEFVQRTAEYLEVDAVLVARQLSSKNKHNLSALRQELSAPREEITRERKLLKLLVESAEARAKVAGQLEPDWLRDPQVREWIRTILSEADASAATWDGLLTQCTHENQRSLLRALMVDDSEPLDATDRTINHNLARIRFTYQRGLSTLLMRQMQEFFLGQPPEAQADPHEQSGEWSRQFDETTREMAQLGKGYFLTPHS